MNVLTEAETGTIDIVMRFLACCANLDMKEWLEIYFCNSMTTLGSAFYHVSSALYTSLGCMLSNNGLGLESPGWETIISSVIVRHTFSWKTKKNSDNVLDHDYTTGTENLTPDNILLSIDLVNCSNYIN